MARSAIWRASGRFERTLRLAGFVSDSPRAQAVNENSAGLNRNHGIDALRGACALLVAIQHLAIRLPLTKTTLAVYLPNWFLLGISDHGYEAVFVFFVISGFLITRRTLARWGSLAQIAPRDFYVLRAARILPCLLLVVIALSVLHLLGVPHFTIDRPDQSLGGAIFAALGLHMNWYEASTGYLPGGWGVMWSLSIEELFYLAFPLLCLTLGRRTWLLALALGAFALSLPMVRAAIVGNELWKEKAYVPGMAAIALGVLTALLAARVPRPARGLASALCAIGLIGLCASFFAERWIWPLLHEGGVLLIVGSAACLVLGLHWQALSAKPWRLRGLGWLRSCGELSYEFYLLHMFCVFGIVALAQASGLDLAHGYVWYLPMVLLTWLLASLVARTVSIPCERWLRRRYVPALCAPKRSNAAVAEPA
jgi:peptidoglycan/LPS O-acetylase OafA/YrhL